MPSLAVAVARKRKLPKRLPRQQQPDAIRLAYFKAIREYVKLARETVNDVLLPQIETLLERAKVERGDRWDHIWLGSLRMDAVGKRISDIIDEISDEFFDENPIHDIAKTAEKFAYRTSDFQKEQLKKQAEAAVGVQLSFQNEPWLKAHVESFTEENVSLIKSIPSKYFDQVEQEVLRAAQLGTRHEDLAETIQERFDVAENSAKLVARDQVGKFYGSLNKTRQEKLGIDSYIWRTSEDARVRPEHRDRNNKTYKWSKPPAGGSHPGIEINCRCYAEPDFSVLLE